MSAVHTVQVGGTQPYAIDIGPGLLGDGTRLAARARGRHALLLSDSHVAPLYADTVTDALRRARPGLQVAVHVMPAGESHKTLDSSSAAIDALATLGATRDATVFARGGGVVGDLAGFTAACWMRGIDCVQLPPPCWPWSTPRSAARPQWTSPRAKTWSAPSIHRAR